MFKKSRLYVLLALVSVFLISVNVYAAKEIYPNPATAEQGMTLWKLILAGGSCMIFLALLSVFATISVLYHFKQVRAQKLTPEDFTQELLVLLERGEFDKAYSLCKQRPNLISAITEQGIKKVSKGNIVVEEAIQNEGKARIARLWKNLSYLGDVAVIAPMIGLLGTVLGMIQAFNFVAFQTGVVKPVLLAQGLAKAMVTTAFGLVIAVFVMIFYSYFRGRVSALSSNIERIALEVSQLITRAKA